MVFVRSAPVLLVTLAACAAPATPSPASVPAPPPAPTLSAAATPVAAAAPAPAAEPPAKPPLPEPVRALQKSILDGHGAVDAVASLTTEVGARLAGSAGDKAAIAWALAAMRERGLSNVHAEPVKVPVWKRGLEVASIVSPVPHSLAVAALGWSGATPAKGVEAEVVRFDSLDALRGAADGSLKGKIAFLDVRMKRTAEGPGYGAAVPARGQGAPVAAKKGALAIVIRSIGSDGSRFPHTGGMKREHDAKSALPAGALSNADADLLERVLAAHGSARLSLNLQPQWLGEADSANVVGEIPGRAAPKEVVLVGAHLDSWDLGEGALDDGAGCGIALEAGRALAAMADKPRRTVRIVLFAAEENSLSGGKQYAAAHAAEVASHVAAMEADFGTGRVQRAGYIGSPGSREQFLALAPLLDPLGVTTSADKQGHGGADIGPLGMLGVPLVDLDQDDARYFDTHHTANDTFARIDGETLTQAAAAFATAAWALADATGDLGRVPEAERAER